MMPFSQQDITRKTTSAERFVDLCRQWPPETVSDLIYCGWSQDDVHRALTQTGFAPHRAAALLSPEADTMLEPLAREAVLLTRQNFGRAMQFYAPLYLSNRCCNACRYCGFNRANNMPRRTLSLAEAETEAESLADSGIQHILLVSGEDPDGASPDMLSELITRLKRRFSSVSVEIYPLSQSDYERLVNAGLDGVTLYQETYDPGVYRQMHPAGPKRDYAARLQAIEDAARAGTHSLGIGTLLGLNDWRVEAFYLALHAHYLRRTYWRSATSISFPRLKEARGDFQPPSPVDDKSLTHMICAMRILHPDAGLVLSTREPARLRDNLMPLGITRISAGSRTQPGGYTSPDNAAPQFAVHDDRTIAEMVSSVRELGFDPVLKDWDSTL